MQNNYLIGDRPAIFIIKIDYITHYLVKRWINWSYSSMSMKISEHTLAIKNTLIYKFYEDYRYQNAEKRFEHLHKFDIQSCFDSIYTHSIT